MSVTGEPRSFWRSIRQLPRRTPLRVKLITALLTLVAIALAVISVAGISVLRTYLINQADGQLGTLYAAAQTQAQGFGGQASPASPGPEHWVYEADVQGKIEPVHGGTLPVGDPRPAVAGVTEWLANHPGQAITIAAQSGGARWRVVGYPDFPFANTQTHQPVSGMLIVGLDVSSVYSTISRLTYIDLLVSVIVILGLAVVGVAVVRASLRPLTEIEKTAEAIAAGDLTRRVPDLDPRTEVGRLGRSLNTMLSQIEMAFRSQARSEAAARRSEERMRQFVADASHELRTPLTAIRGFAEYYRQRGGVDTTGRRALGNSADRARPPADPDSADATAAPDGGAAADTVGSSASGQLAPADLDRIMRRVEQEASRMGVLVEDMLLLARLDQQRPLEYRTVDLLTLAADAVHDARMVAPDRSINLTVGAGAALLVLGDEVRLRQVIGNLMSNALSHTPEGTPIDVQIRSGSLDEARAPGTAQPAPPPRPGPPATPPDPVTAARPNSAAVLEVTDHGPGLTRDQAEHAFERFYRADQARTTGGTGLGLAIVAALVAAHGGAVWVESAPGAGATFRIALPLAPEALPDDEQDDSVEEDTSPGDTSPGDTSPGGGTPHNAAQHNAARVTEAREHDPLSA